MTHINLLAAADFLPSFEDAKLKILIDAKFLFSVATREEMFSSQGFFDIFFSRRQEIKFHA